MVGDGAFELPTWAALPAQPNEAFDALARRLAEQMSVPMAFVVLVSKAGHVFPGAFGLPERWDERRSLPPGGSPSQRIARTGRPLAIPDLWADPRGGGTAAPPQLGITAYAGAPVLDAEGRPLGVLCAVDVQPRNWSAAEMAVLDRFAAECAHLLQVQAFELAQREARNTAERAASAAQHIASAARAALAAAEAEADRARVVARLGAALLPAATFEEVLPVVDRFVRSPLGATATVLGLTEPGGAVLQAWPTGAAGVDRSATLPLESAHPLAVAARERRPVTVTEGPLPALPSLSGPALESAAAVPLVLGQHASSGALLVGWQTRRDVDPAVQRILGDLAAHVGMALDRVLLAAARERLELVARAVAT
jgi:GAF domain-containing protein